jgi:hypothetical protein
MKRLDLLKQEIYKKEIEEILLSKQEDLEIAKNFILERFQNFKNFKDYINQQQKQNQSRNKAIIDHFKDNKFFCYLTRTNAPINKIIDNLNSGLPNRVTRHEEQFSYLEKFSKHFTQFEDMIEEGAELNSAADGSKELKSSLSLDGYFSIEGELLKECMVDDYILE